MLCPSFSTFALKFSYWKTYLLLIFITPFFPVLDCFPTLELDATKATNNALGQNFFYKVGPEHPKEKQAFNFKWSIIYFVISGASFLACKFLWRWMEGDHLTRLSKNLLQSRSEPDKRDLLATDIVSYINDCEKGQQLMAMYSIANIISLCTMIGLTYMYFESVDYFNNPFTVNEFYQWTKTQAEQRTDTMIKLFPRLIEFPYESTGPSGTLQKSQIFCTAGINATFEYIYAATLIFMPIVTLVHIFSMILSILSVVLFHLTTDKDNLPIKGIKSLTYGQRLLLNLLAKNIDDNLWYVVLSKIPLNPSDVEAKSSQSLNGKDNCKEKIILECRTEEEKRGNKWNEETAGTDKVNLPDVIQE